MKKALVTGASKGIGLAFAKRLRKDGYEVTGVARSTSVLANLTGADGPLARHIVADLSERDGVERVCKDIATGGYDIFIGNAGIGLFGSYEQSPYESIDALFRLNCLATAELAHSYLKSARSGDTLVTISSGIGMLSAPGGAAYCASKYFVLGLTESIWFEQKQRGVFVTCICPGPTKTDFFSAPGADQGPNPPSIMYQTADQVVRDAMRAIKKRRTPSVVTGAISRHITFFTRHFFTRRGVVNFMGNMR